MKKYAEERKAIVSDDGCEYASRCLECPLPLCKYDSTLAILQMKLKERDDKIVRMFSAGKSKNEIAKKFNVSERTVDRALAKRRRRNAVQR